MARGEDSGSLKHGPRFSDERRAGGYEISTDTTWRIRMEELSRAERDDQPEEPLEGSLPRKPCCDPLRHAVQPAVAPPRPFAEALKLGGCDDSRAERPVVENPPHRGHHVRPG